MSAPIEVGACYRDPSDGEVVRALSEEALPSAWRCRVIVAASSDDVGDEVLRDMAGWQRVPDPTPAVIDDVLEAGEEYQRQERIDATARAVFVRGGCEVSEAYLAADALEAARERYIASRKGGAK